MGGLQREGLFATVPMDVEVEAVPPTGQEKNDVGSQIILTGFR